MNKSVKNTSNSRMRPLSGTVWAEGENMPYISGEVCSYYRDRLPFDERAIYASVKEGMLNGSSKIMVGSVSNKRCEEILNAVLLDTPMLFHINGCSVTVIGRNTYLMPKYTMPNGGYKRYERECNTALRKLCDRAKGDEWNRILSLHTVFLDGIMYREDSPEAHDIIGPLLRHGGVCDGIAKSVKASCDMMGIPCVVVRGEARKSDGNIGSHAWNAIKIEGDWRFFDFTFDITLNQNNPCRGLQRMDYFSVGFEEISADHNKWSIDFKTSRCGKDFFERNGLVLHKQDELDRMICHSVKKPIECTFKVDAAWKGFDGNRSVERAVQKLIDATNSSCRYSYSFNESMRVGYIRIE